MMDVVKWLIIMSYEYHCDVASYGTTSICRAKADKITCQLVSQMQANWYLCLVYRTIFSLTDTSETSSFESESIKRPRP